MCGTQTDSLILVAYEVQTARKGLHGCERNVCLLRRDIANGSCMLCPSLLADRSLASTDASYRTTHSSTTHTISFTRETLRCLLDCRGTKQCGAAQLVVAHNTRFRPLLSKQHSGGSQTRLDTRRFARLATPTEAQGSFACTNTARRALKRRDTKFTYIDGHKEPRELHCFRKYSSQCNFQRRKRPLNITVQRYYIRAQIAKNTSVKPSRNNI